MTPSRFIEQQQALGYVIHQHDGVWWQLHGPFYWKPVVPYERIAPNAAHPAPHKSLAGYSHAVPDNERSNWAWPIVLLEWTAGRPFEIDDLPSKRRNCIRRGLKLCEVRRLEALEPHVADLQAINISARARTGVGKPVAYYTQQYSKWRDGLLERFKCEGRDWWGAFCQGRLVAYYHTFDIGDMMLIDTAKGHSDYLKYCPNDAILFVVMQHALNNRACRYIDYGGWTPGDERLLFFKQEYGFRRRDIPAYLRLSLPARLVYMVRRWYRSRPS